MRPVMKRNCRHHLVAALVVILGVFALNNVAMAAAKHTHHDGKQMLGEKFKTEGHHVIDKKGDYTTSVEVKSGKVAGIHVQHATKGEVEVKKYKTHKKMARVRAHSVYASFRTVQD